VTAHAHPVPVPAVGWVRLARRVLGAVGVGMLAYGVVRLLLVAPLPDLFHLLLWLVSALVVHDGLLSPVALALGATLGRWVPDRARTYLQGGLVAGAMITAVAIPLIYLEGSQPPEKALLLQRYGLNLTVLLALVAAVSLALYALRVARDRRSDPAAGPLADEDRRVR